MINGPGKTHYKDSGGDAMYTMLFFKLRIGCNIVKDET